MKNKKGQILLILFSNRKLKMEYKKQVLFAVFLSCFALVGQKVDIYFGGGTCNFLGDLGGKPTLGTNDASDLDILSTRYGITAGTRINFGRYFALRADVWYARVYGNDKYTVNRERRSRNLNFHSYIFEADALAEVNFARSRNGRGLYYAFGGVGVFTFNPKTKYNGKVYTLRDYGTEGQYAIPGKSPYKLSSVCFPVGFGYKLAVGRGRYLAFELNMRKTKTDYIDDVSTYFVDPNLLIAAKGQIAADLADRSDGNVANLSIPGGIRGHYWNNDSYFFINITYNMTLGIGNGSSAFKVGRPRRSNINGKRKCFEF